MSGSSLILKCPCFQKSQSCQELAAFPLKDFQQHRRLSKYQRQQPSAGLFQNYSFWIYYARTSMTQTSPFTQMQFLINKFNQKHRLSDIAAVFRGLALVVSAVPPQPFSAVHSHKHQHPSAPSKSIPWKPVIFQNQPKSQKQLSQYSLPSGSLGRLMHLSRIGINVAASGVFNKVIKGKQRAVDQKLAKYLATQFCKLRGAPLKLLQVLSIQQDQLIPAEIKKAFQVARNQAFKMPTKQLHSVLVKSYGVDWKNKFQKFQEEPFAAASIGQVHRGVIQGKQVAIKIQYSGVRDSIQKDLQTVVSLLNMTKSLPKTLFIDKLISNTKQQLLQQCNYLKQRQFQLDYKKQLTLEDKYYVPQVFELTRQNVLVSQFVQGATLQFISKQPQQLRNYVGSLILRLTLLQIFRLPLMQSDPNPTNFSFNGLTGQLNLIDFGATHRYNQQFLSSYRNLIKAGINKDQEQILKLSIQIGFMNGNENSDFKEAHVDSIKLLGQPFRQQVFDFSNQDLTKRIYKNIPRMLKNRLKPPPFQVYSLHRKFSGAFLMNMNLASQVRCRDLLNTCTP